MLFSNITEEWWIGNTMNLRDVSAIIKRRMVDKHILTWFGERDIIEIDDVYINQFIINERDNGNRLTGKGLCHNTIVKEISVLREIFKYAEIKGYIKNNPMLLIKGMKKVPVKEYNTFSYDEVQKLIQNARPKWLGDLILLAYHTGMRKCECYGLQWNDINFENKSLMVVRSVTATQPNERLITEPKTKTSKRIILLDDKTISMLNRRYKDGNSDTWVFANQYGELISPWYNVKYFRDACIRSGIPIRRFYDLRHTHITELVTAGIPLPVIQKRAGHSDIKMTMHYTHIQPEMQQCAVELLNGRFANK